MEDRNRQQRYKLEQQINFKNFSEFINCFFKVLRLKFTNNKFHFLIYNKLKKKNFPENNLKMTSLDSMLSKIDLKNEQKTSEVCKLISYLS